MLPFVPSVWMQGQEQKQGIGNRRPNIIFIMSDDHARQAMSIYGHPIGKIAPTPHIDRIGHEGAVFQNNYCCNSISGPSRAAILTGKHSHKNGFMRNGNKGFDGSQQTLPKILQANGYETAIIGKWHLVSKPTGFDHWMILNDQGDYYNPYFITEGDTTRHKGYVTDLITQYCEDWMSGREDKNKPFFLMMHHKAIEVPTTCGTGSEVTTVAVLTVHNEKTKKSMSHRIFPRMALVDEKYIKNAPLKVICDTAIDALAHIVESCINNNATEYSKMFAKEGLEAWSKFKDVLLGNREATDEDFHNMMYASTLAGMCIAHAGTSLPHGLSYPITYELGIPHGKAVGYFLPGYINEATDEDKEFVLKAAGFESVEEFSKFYKKACGYEKFPQELLDKTGELILSNQRKLANCPYKVDAEVIKNIISF